LEDDSDEEEDRNKVKHEVEEDEKEKEKTNGEPPIPEEKEEEEVEVKKEEEVEEDDGIDPLDAYMITVQEEVTKIKQGGKTQTPKEKLSSSQSGVVFMEGSAKKKDSSKDKGELIEQNQDGLEVFHYACVYKLLLILYFAVLFRRRV
jgi:hypothetical protein